jgi:hypothetical protein
LKPVDVEHGPCMVVFSRACLIRADSGAWDLLMAAASELRLFWFDFTSRCRDPRSWSGRSQSGRGREMPVMVNKPPSARELVFNDLLSSVGTWCFSKRRRFSRRFRRPRISRSPEQHVICCQCVVWRVSCHDSHENIPGWNHSPSRCFHRHSRLLFLWLFRLLNR